MAALTKQKSWDTFVDWCTAHGLCAAPAHPWTVAAYIRSLEDEMRLSSIERHLGLIGQVHFEKLRKRPDRDPMVKRTLQTLRQREELKRTPQPPTLFRADDFLNAKPVGPLKPVNDVRPSGPGRRSLRNTPRLVRRKKD